LIQIQTSATFASDCPQNWKLSLPAPKYTRTLIPEVTYTDWGTKSTKPPYEALVPNMGGIGWREISTIDWSYWEEYFVQYWTPVFGNDNMQKIISLKSDLQFASRIVSNPSFAEKRPDGSLVQIYPLSVSRFKAADKYVDFFPTDASFWQSGITNGSQIRYEIDFFVRGCNPLYLKSEWTKVDFVKLPDIISIDQWISDYESWGRKWQTTYNWRKASEEKVTLVQEIDNMQKGKNIGLSKNFRASINVEQALPYGVVIGIDPPGCMFGSLPSSMDAVVYTQPCKYLVSVKYFNQNSSPVFMSDSYKALGYFMVQMPNSKGARELKSIICVKGKLTKKVTGSNPKCPTGYKKK